MKNRNLMALAALLIAGQGFVAWAFIEETHTLERELMAVRDSVPVRVDTIYQPPKPDFITAFRLQCEWVPRKDTTDAQG